MNHLQTFSLLPWTINQTSTFSTLFNQISDWTKLKVSKVSVFNPVFFSHFFNSIFSRLCMRSWGGKPGVLEVPGPEVSAGGAEEESQHQHCEEHPVFPGRWWVMSQRLPPPHPLLTRFGLSLIASWPGDSCFLNHQPTERRKWEKWDWIVCLVF